MGLATPGRLRGPVLLAILAGLAGLPGCAADGVPDPVFAEGISWELAQLRKGTLSDVHYAFRLSVPMDPEEPLQGSMTLTVSREDPDGRPLILDFVAPGERVHEVRVEGVSVQWQPVADHVVIPGSVLPEGDVSVEVDFTAGDGALNRNEDFLYTLFVPDRAHFSVPILDQPNLKARYTLSLDIPEGWRAVANGPLLDEDVQGGRARLRFAETEPIPSYLFAFAVGEFQVETAVRAGREINLYHRETDQEKVARNIEQIFDLHAAALAWLEDYTGIPYPFQKFDFVAIPSFQYGGMEHPGSVLYRASSLFLESSATQGQALGRGSVIAHETAHMWFGDLVTMDWFDDVWMKEVFANFMAAKIINPSFPEVNHDLRFFLAHYPRAYGIDRTEGANPIRQPLENLNQAGTLYGAIIYQKAPIVMKQLELLLGEESMRDGLREYLEVFSGGNATWDDLIRILDLRSAEDLNAWSDIWVDAAGRPTLSAQRTLRSDGSLEALTIFSEDQTGADRAFPQPLWVMAGWGDDVDVQPVRLAGLAVGVPEWSGRQPPDFVIPNARGVGYGHMHLDPASARTLLDRVNGIDDELLRGVIRMNLWDATLEGEVSPDDFLVMALDAIGREPVEQNLQQVLGNMATTFWRLLAEAERGSRAADVESVLWAELHRVRPAGKPTRKAALYRAYRNLVVTQEGSDRIRTLWAQEDSIPGLRLSEDDFTSMALGLAIREVDGWRTILDVQESRITNPDRKARFRFLRPSVDAAARVRERFFESLKDEGNRAREPWALAGLGNLNHALRRGHAEQFVLPALELVEEIQRTGDIFFPQRWLGAVLGGHNSPAVAATVRDFLGARPDYPPRLRQEILQSADMLERAARIAHGEG